MTSIHHVAVGPSAEAAPLPLIQYCFRTYGSVGVCLGWQDLAVSVRQESVSRDSAVVAAP